MSRKRKTGRVLAIDPGNVQSAAVIMDSKTYKPLEHIKACNDEIQELILEWDFEEAAVEMVASYGMPVGASVFETCVWIGRFCQMIEDKGVPVKLIYRGAEKMTICHSPQANDATIRRALVDRFAKDAPNYGKGTKASPGWFYGFGADIWQAYAVGVTYLDWVNNYYYVGGE